MNPSSPDAPRLKVAQLIETLAMGGAERLAVNTANQLAADGHDAHLIVMHGPGELSAHIRPEVQVHYLGFERVNFKRPLRFLAYLFQGQRALKRLINGAGVSVVQTHLPGANYLGLLLARQRVCAVLATVHNNREFRYGSAERGLVGRLRKWAYRRILVDTQGMVAVSSEVKDSLIRELRVAGPAVDRIRVITNAVEVPARISDGRVAEIRQQFACGADDVFLLAAGRFCAQKNFGDLVTVALRLRKAGCRFRLVMAGEGVQREPLAEQIRQESLADQVSLPGNVTNLDEVMQAADVFVMSSLWEGLPLVLLEAMAAGLPTVAYGIPGVEDVIADGRSGRLAPVGDCEALAGRLGDLMADPAARVAMGAAAQAQVRADFSFSAYVTALTRTYGRMSPKDGEGPP